MGSLRGAGHSAHPDSAWVAATRSRVLQHIYQTTEEVPQRVVTLNHLWSALSLIMPQRTVYTVVRPAFIFVLCFVLGTAGWITTVTASLESLPGDALYAVKIATEHTQVAVTHALQGREASAQLRVSFATRRADEVSKAVATGSPADDKHRERVEQAVENLKTEVETVSAELKEVNQENPVAAARVALAIDHRVNVIEQTLVASGAHATTTATAAVAAIAELKLEVDRVKTADAAASTSTPPTAVVAAPVVVPPPANTSTSTVVISEQANASTTVRVLPAPAPVAKPEEHPEPAPQKDEFPERPPELAPDVVDAPTPIGIQTWE